jgi:hypothetical protein
MGWLLACSGLRINPILLVMSCLAGRWCVLDINKSHPTGFEKLPCSSRTLFWRVPTPRAPAVHLVRESSTSPLSRRGWS